MSCCWSLLHHHVLYTGTISSWGQQFSLFLFAFPAINEIRHIKPFISYENENINSVIVSAKVEMVGSPPGKLKEQFGWFTAGAHYCTRENPCPLVILAWPGGCHGDALWPCDSHCGSTFKQWAAMYFSGQIEIEKLRYLPWITRWQCFIMKLRAWILRRP